MKRNLSAFCSKCRGGFERIPDWLCMCIFALMPAIILFLISAVKHIDVFALSTVYNDEISWYNQAIAVAEYGRPLGYWGFNGTHAQFGTFGAWGPVSVFFMSLFLKPLHWMFPGAGVSIYILNNLLWACGANLLFVILARPKKNNLLRLIVIYAFLFVNHCYMFEAMSEPIRFSMGVVLAGVACYLIHRRDASGYRFVLYGFAPFVILSFMGAYIMFAVMLPVWLYAIYKEHFMDNNRNCAGIYIFVSAAAFILVSLIVYYITCLYTSPYVTDGITDILASFENGLGNGLRFLAGYILNNIANCDLKFILSSTDVYGGFFVFYLPLYYALGIYLTVSTLLGWKKLSVRDKEIHIISAFVMCAFMAAFILLYSTYYWILVRGINIALVIALYLLCMKEKTVEIPVIAAVSLLGVIPFMLVCNNTFIYGRAAEDQAVDYGQVFSQFIQVSEESDPWENTIACYGDETRGCLELPTGMAINSMMNKRPNENARYAMIWLQETNADELSIKDPDTLVRQLEPDHDLLYRDENLILMVRTTE